MTPLGLVADPLTRKWVTELRERVDGSETRLIFTDPSEPGMGPVVYERILLEAQHVRLFTNQVDGAVLNEKDTLLGTLRMRLASGAVVQTLIRTPEYNKPEVFHQLEALRHEFPTTMQIRALRADRKAESLRKNTRGETLGYFTFLTGNDDMYRLEHYDGDENRGTLARAYNGFHDREFTTDLIDRYFDRWFQESAVR